MLSGPGVSEMGPDAYLREGIEALDRGYAVQLCKQRAPFVRRPIRPRIFMVSQMGFKHNQGYMRKMWKMHVGPNFQSYVMSRWNGLGAKQRLAFVLAGAAALRLALGATRLRAVVESRPELTSPLTSYRSCERPLRQS